MFTVAAVGTNVAALPVGAILDYFGPQVCGVLGSAFLAVGAALFAFAWDIPVDTYIPGYLFLALGGPFIFISSFHLSNAFPKYSGLILALLTGAFDASSAVFLVYRILYEQSGRTFLPKKFFLGYLIVPLAILVVQLTLMPKQSYKTVGELVKVVEDSDLVPDDQIDETTALLREETEALHNQRLQQRETVVSEITELLGSKSGSKHVRQEERKQEVSGVWGAMHGKSIQQQILSPWFILIMLFTVLQMTRINYFVATIRTQYEYLLRSDDKAIAVNNFFDVLLPLGGIISIPFIGLVLDNTSALFTLTSLTAIATTIGVLGVLPYTWAAYTNVSLFVLYRPFYYTAVSDYAAKVFGFRTFGTVYGLIICLAGLLNFIQSGLDILTHKTFRGNPTPVNLVLMGLSLVVGMALVVFVGVKSSQMTREQVTGDDEGTRETEMPGLGNGGIFF
jgi:multisubunit Na+/H+ antiporter MnhC subunit